jgi:hypothetical protein
MSWCPKYIAPSVGLRPTSAGRSHFPAEAGENDEAPPLRSPAYASKTDPDAKLYRKGPRQEATLSYLGHVLMENRKGLIVDAMVTEADGTARRDVAMLMVHKRWKRRQSIRSLGADKPYDTRDFFKILREMQVRPDVTQNLNRAGGSATPSQADSAPPSWEKRSEQASRTDKLLSNPAHPNI